MSRRKLPPLYTTLDIDSNKLEVEASTLAPSVEKDCISFTMPLTPPVVSRDIFVPASISVSTNADMRPYQTPITLPHWHML